MSLSDLRAHVKELSQTEDKSKELGKEQGDDRDRGGQER